MGGLNASDISWSTGRISIYERAIAFKRRTFTEARRLVATHNVRRVWIRRGIIYFRVKNNTSFRYTTPDLLLSVLKSAICSLSSRSPVPAACVQRRHSASWVTPCRPPSIFGFGNEYLSRRQTVFYASTLGRSFCMWYWSEMLSLSTFWTSGRLGCEIRSILDPST